MNRRALTMFALLASWLGLSGCLQPSELPEGDWSFFPEKLVFNTTVGTTSTREFTIRNNRERYLEVRISPPILDGNCPEEPFLPTPYAVRVAPNSSQTIRISHAPQLVPNNGSGAAAGASGKCTYLLQLWNEDDSETGRRALVLDGGVKDVDNDGDGVGRGRGDCDDTDPLINPNRRETCNGYDDDCDGLIDDADDNDAAKYDDLDTAELYDTSWEGISSGSDDIRVLGQRPFIADFDGDGFPGENNGVEFFCERPPGYVQPPDPATPLPNGGLDCNDQEFAVFPDAVENPGSGVDRDCDGFVTCYADLDGDGFGDQGAPVDHRLDDPFCTDDGVSTDGTDCVDADATISPNAIERCNGYDDDCDNLVDDADSGVFDPQIWFYDGDSDGFGTPAIVTAACEQPPIYVGNAEDCNDANPNIEPGADEVCDGVDNDCNGLPDDNPVDPLPWYRDQDGDGYGDDTIPTPASVTDPVPTGFQWSCTQPIGFSLLNTDCDDGSSLFNPGAPEVVGDGNDQDCDGLETCYVDNDQDGFGITVTVEEPDADPSTAFFDCPVGTAPVAGDCNDVVDPSLAADGSDAFPGGVEVCDGVDNDCDNKIDDADETLSVNATWIRDGDGDGFGDSGLVVFACTAPAGFIAYDQGVDPVDCLDDDGSAYPGANEIPADGIDQDCDGFEDCYLDADGDGFGNAAGVLVDGDKNCAQIGMSDTFDDCDDTLATVNPSVVEVCDGGVVDEDCDGFVDDDDPDVFNQDVWYRDADGDGFGNVEVVLSRCAQPSGYVPDPGDCNDTTAAVFPGASEICNGTDDDCDGAVDDADPDLDATNPNSNATEWYQDGDNDGYGTTAVVVRACDRPVGFVSADGDCDDQLQNINPGAGETIGDDLDRNCDGLELCYLDDDGDSWGSGEVDTVDIALGCGSVGFSDKAGDCDDASTDVAPDQPEVCDGVDNDCDFLTDDADPSVQPDPGDLTQRWLRDADNDGFGDSGNTQLACSQPPGFVAYFDPAGPPATPAETDCNDGNFNIKPGVAEVPADDVDQNCNGEESCFTDADGDGYGISTPTPEAPGDLTCQGVGRSSRDDDCDDGAGSVFPGAVEECNGIDDDCDGLTDDEDSDVLDGQLWFRDGDGDGFGNIAISLQRCDAPANFVADSGDCNDLRADVRPGGTERCDNQDVDEDCDGLIDDIDYDDFLANPTTEQFDTSTLIPFYPDADGDAYGDASGTARQGCDATLFEVANADDCDDDNAAIRPGAIELTGDQVDQNCDGSENCYVDNDGDGYGNSAFIVSVTGTTCSGSGLASIGGDCDDANPTATTQQSPYFYDNDGDGFGNPAVLVIECGPPGPEWVDNASDCDDSRDFVNPSAAELCDDLDLDEDCDGLVDNADYLASLSDPSEQFDVTTLNTFYPDDDSDGFGDAGGTSVQVCDPTANQVTTNTDCDDANNAIRPGVPEIPGDLIDQNCDDAETCFVDSDGDGFGTSSTVLINGFFGGAFVNTCDGQPGAAGSAGDCDDTTTAIAPDADEVCNGLDDDCDGLEDDDDDSLVPDTTDPSQTFWFDADGDGYGNSAFTVYQCTRPVGFVPAATATDEDCDDADFSVRPGVPERTGDGIDQNCDGDELCYIDADDDGVGINNTAVVTGFFAPGSPWTTCADVPNRASLPGDCNDNDPGVVSDAGVLYRDNDGDGFGDPAVSVQTCTPPPGNWVGNSSDCNDFDATVVPITGDETTCDGIDSDCDGQIDEDSAFDIWFFDGDGDGYGSDAVSQLDCATPGASWVLVPGDCADTNAARNPSATDNTCDGVDDDCDGVADQAAPFQFWYFDGDNDGFGTDVTQRLECANPYFSNGTSVGGDCDDSANDVFPGALETCDGDDQDCDGQVDEGLVFNTWFQDFDGDGYGRNATALYTCNTNPFGPTFSTQDGDDCNDANSAINPGATEVCNGLDDDCSGLADDGAGTVFYRDLDGDGDGDPAEPTASPSCNAPAGYVSSSDDCDDGNATVYDGAPELCDGLDNDCNTSIDDGAGVASWPDGDGDGQGDAAASPTTDCTIPSGRVGNGDDCDDADATIYDGAPDLCDGLLNDCGSTLEIDELADCGPDTTWWLNPVTNLPYLFVDDPTVLDDGTGNDAMSFCTDRGYRILWLEEDYGGAGTEEDLVNSEAVDVFGDAVTYWLGTRTLPICGPPSDWYWYDGTCSADAIFSSRATSPSTGDALVATAESVGPTTPWAPDDPATATHPFVCELRP